MSLFRGGASSSSLPQHLLTLATLRLVTSSQGQAFTHVRAAPIRVLAHVLGNYLALLGNTAKARAEAAGRTNVSFADAASAIESFGMATPALIELIFQLKASAPRSEAAQTLERQMHNSGQLLNNVLGDTKTGRSLAYELFSEEELAALEKAAESEPEEEIKPPIPSSSSSDLSSLSDSDMESSRMRVDKPKTPVRPLKRKASLMVKEETPDADVEAVLNRWRSPGLVPEHIQPFLPPLPGLARGDRPEDELEDANMLPAPSFMQQATRMRTSAEMWRSSVPYARSKLAEIGSAANVPHITAPPQFDLQEEGSMNAFNKLQQRFIDAPRQAEQLVPNEKRRKVAGLLLSHRMDMQDSLTGAIPPDAYRQSARSAGWVPYAYDQLGRPSIYLRDFDGPLIDSLSATVATQPATYAPPAGRSPSIMSHLTRQLALQNPVMASRLLRLAPPGPVDDQGNTIPYLLDDKGAQLAVAQPAHQSPLYFVPGWFWKTRDPLDANLPKTYKAVPIQSAIDELPPETALEPLAETIMTNGDASGAEEMPKSDHRAESEVLRAVSEPQISAGPSQYRSRETTENGFITPVGGTPVPMSRGSSGSGSVLPQVERKDSERKIKIRLPSYTPVRPEVPSIETQVERSASPAVPATATPVSAGGTKLKLKLSFGGSKPKASSVTAASQSLRESSMHDTRSTEPESSLVVKQEDEQTPAIPLSSVKQTSPILSRVSEEPDNEPLVPMPPPKQATPHPALMSPVILGRGTGNGINGTHASETPPP